MAENNGDCGQFFTYMYDLLSRKCSYTLALYEIEKVHPNYANTDESQTTKGSFIYIAAWFEFFTILICLEQSLVKTFGNEI